MSEKEIKVKKKKKKLSKSALVLIIALIIILIPCAIFGYILLSASMKTGTPILGERFQNDLNPTISESSKSNVKSAIETISGVEKVEIVMTSAQLRINIDAKDTLTKDEIAELAYKAYDAVNKELPISTYFTISASGAKMYDLSINVYNYIAKSGDDDSFIYYVITKNSKMEDKSEQFVSEPVDPELAKELNGETAEGETESTETK